MALAVFDPDHAPSDSPGSPRVAKNWTKKNIRKLCLVIPNAGKGGAAAPPFDPPGALRVIDACRRLRESPRSNLNELLTLLMVVFCAMDTEYGNASEFGGRRALGRDLMILTSDAISPDNCILRLLVDKRRTPRVYA